MEEWFNEEQEQLAARQKEKEKTRTKPVTVDFGPFPCIESVAGKDSTVTKYVCALLVLTSCLATRPCQQEGAGRVG